MKVFISHQRADSAQALSIQIRLDRVHGIASYLDVVDPNASSTEDLSEHVKAELGRCTQLLAVVSEATKASWWVPWEIGIATEKDHPLATFAGGNTLVPEYLRKWPYLRSDYDLDLYAQASKATARELATKRTYLEESVARHRSTKEFFRVLRKSLGQ